MRKHAGFTLAEVLITLGIIGVVAAMTIPTLMSNTGKSEFKTAYKKIISAVNQAVTMSVAIDYLDFGDAYSGTANTESIYRILQNKMQIAKTETSTSNPEIERMFKASGNSNYTIFFADGMVLSYPKNAANCTNQMANERRTVCAGIVDVNGTKNPNKLSHCQWSSSEGTGSTITNDTTVTGGGSSCVEENTFISDQYSVIFKGQQLIPNGYAARYVLYEK